MTFDLEVDLVAVPDWQRDALCAEYASDADWWFPTTGQPNTPAKEICARCLVTAECLAFAFEERLTEGIRPDGSIAQWELLSGVVTKHYATVGPLTATLDATFDLVINNNIAADDIAEIHVDCMRRTAIFNTRHPENDVAARASLPYCVAVAVCRKDPSLLLGPAFRQELLRDKAIWAAADKVRGEIDFRRMRAS